MGIVSSRYIGNLHEKARPELNMNSFARSRLRTNLRCPNFLAKRQNLWI